MDRTAIPPSEELTRIPGLFRRWELPAVFETHRHYHLEEAGTHADGTPLVAIYVSDRASTDGGFASKAPVAPEAGDPAGIGSPPVRLLVTEEKLLGWLASAERGDTLEYHRGVLAIDRLAIGSRLPKQEARELARVAKAAMAAAEAGRAHLLQRRHGNNDYSYLIVAIRCGGGRGLR